MKDFFDDPLAVCADAVPAFITFPSLKDLTWQRKHPTKVCCQMLMMAEYEWFEQYATAQRLASSSKTKNNLNTAEQAMLTEYHALKGQWAARATQILLKYYPKVCVSKLCFALLWLHLCG